MSESTGALAPSAEQLLAAGGLSEGALQTALGEVLHRQVDQADVYMQRAESESWTLENQVVREAGHAREQGLGVRAIAGEKTGFAYADDLTLPALQQAVTAARAIARAGQDGTLPQLQGTQAIARYGSDNPLQAMADSEKTTLLKSLDERVRALDSRIEQVVVSLAASHEDIVIANAEGQLVADTRPLVRLNVSVIVNDKGRREQGYAGGGGRYSLREFMDQDLGFAFGREAVRQALVQLEAQPAPAGLMPVVLGPGWPAVLLHEAIGHGLEGDFNRKGTSAFSNRIGEQVASPLCTIVDDGTLANRRGSLTVDDEGTPTACTVLIENGILKGYMQDVMNARLMGTTSTGNGRRESYAHLPMPRMTNTYMLNGQHDPDEIIASVERGLYAPNFGGGQVDITSGKFVFSASEAYLIENGKLGAPVKGATLIGNGPEVLTEVSMVGNDMQLDSGVGVCGKEGQSVPVGVGQPTLKIDQITVGGTQ
ncbi:MAG: metalloprotease TldD [Pseudomonadota bacterium]